MVQACTGMGQAWLWMRVWKCIYEGAGVHGCAQVCASMDKSMGEVHEGWACGHGADVQPWMRCGWDVRHEGTG